VVGSRCYFGRRSCHAIYHFILTSETLSRPILASLHPTPPGALGLILRHRALVQQIQDFTT
jgi:hypothetical protein